MRGDEILARALSVPGRGTVRHEAGRSPTLTAGASHEAFADPDRRGLTEADEMLHIAGGSREPRQKRDSAWRGVAGWVTAFRRNRHRRRYKYAGSRVAQDLRCGRP